MNKIGKVRAKIEALESGIIPMEVKLWIGGGKLPKIENDDVGALRTIPLKLKTKAIEAEIKEINNEI